MILLGNYAKEYRYSFSRTRGGDPNSLLPLVLGSLVFPALAGVILSVYHYTVGSVRFSRTRGGDPLLKTFLTTKGLVFPALAGVILDFL